MQKLGSLSTLARHFRPDARETALNTLAELNNNYHKPKTFLTSSPHLEIKYVLRVLRRAADNPRLAAKLQKKKNRLDNDTRDLLGLDKNETPTRKAILERVGVIESYRKLHGVELERYHCGWLRVIYERYGAHLGSRARLRAFVIDALTQADIHFPDPNKHPDRLDDWITTPIEQPIDPATHHKAAQQAKRLT